MIARFSSTYHASKNVGRCIFAPYQRVQTLTQVKNSNPEVNDGYSENATPHNTFNHADSPGIFKNVSLVTPKIFTKLFYQEFKLKFVDEKDRSKPGIELLRNIAAKYDYWMVRNNQGLLLYYRLELMAQRLAYLKSVGLDSKQKLKQIQRSPPPVLFTFTDCTYTGKLIYLRGMLEKEEGKFMHLFYPASNKIRDTDKISIQNHLQTVEDELRIKRPAALRELLHMPCFFMDPSLLKEMSHMFIHKYSMPQYYSIDKHTAQVLPPICNISKLGLTAEKHFTNTASNSVLASLPSYRRADILDYSYPTTNGIGTPECLSTFLVRMDVGEEKDRTGGQPLKGRRGINVPKRTY